MTSLAGTSKTNAETKPEAGAGFLYDLWELEKFYLKNKEYCDRIAPRSLTGAPAKKSFFEKFKRFFHF